MNFTLEQLHTLEAAIAEGVLLVEYDHRQVRYRSLDEMLRIRNLLREQLKLKDSAHRILTTVSNGLHDE